MPPSRKHFGQLVRSKRMKLGLTLDNLAELSNIDRSNLSRIENGARLVGPRVRVKLSSALSLTDFEISEYLAGYDENKVRLASRLVGSNAFESNATSFDEIIRHASTQKLEATMASIGAKLSSFHNENNLRRAFSYFIENADKLDNSIMADSPDAKFHRALSQAISSGNADLARTILVVKDAFNEHTRLAELKVRVAGHMALQNFDSAIEELRVLGVKVLEDSNENGTTIILDCLGYVFNTFRALKEKNGSLHQVCDALAGVIDDEKNWKAAYSLNILRARILREDSIGQLGVFAIRQLGKALNFAERAAEVAVHVKQDRLLAIAHLELAIIELLISATSYSSRHDPLLGRQNKRVAVHHRIKKSYQFFTSVMEQVPSVLDDTSISPQLVDLYLVSQSIPGLAKADGALAYFMILGDDWDRKREIGSVAEQATNMLAESGFRREFVEAKVKLSLAGLSIESGFELISKEQRDISIKHFNDVKNSVPLYFAKPAKLENIITKKLKKREQESSGSEA